MGLTIPDVPACPFHFGLNVFYNLEKLNSISITMLKKVIAENSLPDIIDDSIFDDERINKMIASIS